MLCQRLVLFLLKRREDTVSRYLFHFRASDENIMHIKYIAAFMQLSDRAYPNLVLICKCRSTEDSKKLHLYKASIIIIIYFCLLYMVIYEQFLCLNRLN